MSVAEAQQRISSREFAEWMAYNRIEPFGYERSDLGHAITAATVANSARGKKGRTAKVADFLPRFSDKPAMSEARLKAVVRSIQKSGWTKAK